MKLYRTLLVVFAVSALAGNVYAEAPKVDHPPVTTAIRGVPTLLHCTVDAKGLLLTQTVARIRLAESGTPSTMPLTKVKNGHETTVPVPMVQGIHAFWYSLDVSNEKGETTSTHWQRVVILEGGIKGGGAAAGGSRGSGAGMGKVAGIVGGIVLLGGAAVGVDALLDDGNGGRAKPAVTNKPPVRRPAVARGPFQCNTLSGLEQVSYMNLTVSNASPILIAVCQTCSNATISATGTWGASDEITLFNNPTCSANAPTLSLAKPISRGFIPDGTYMIDVFANGQHIGSTPWPQDAGSPPPIFLRPVPKTGK